MGKAMTGGAWMRPVGLLLALQLTLSVTSPATAAHQPEILDGCQGEGCNCFAEYPESGDRAFEIPTIRPFTLYEGMSKQSRRLGEFKAGTKGRAGKQRIRVDDPGDYRVEKVRDRKAGLRVGDHVDTLIYMGEGASKARRDGKWVMFDEEAITLGELRPTRLSEWLEVTVGTRHGFTAEIPFEGCLE